MKLDLADVYRDCRGGRRVAVKEYGGTDVVVRMIQDLHTRTVVVCHLRRCACFLYFWSLWDERVTVWSLVLQRAKVVSPCNLHCFSCWQQVTRTRIFRRFDRSSTADQTKPNNPLCA